MRNQEYATMVVQIREQVIEIYMALISAPFLAIAIYYLLQVIATNIAKPLVVLVSFATGFISDSIVKAITNFATAMVNKCRWARKEKGKARKKTKPVKTRPRKSKQKINEQRRQNRNNSRRIPGSLCCGSIRSHISGRVIPV
jgi:hypothetical protein